MRADPRPLLCIATPAMADANNGNWQTARRWQRLLSGHYRVALARHWAELEGPERPAALIALHARRSAPAIADWAREAGGAPLVVVLTGTDLYRDIAHDADARRSIGLAHRLVVLQERAPLALPEALRARCRVVFQSCPARAPLPRPRTFLRAVMVGHLRDEKWPQTLFEAARAIAPHEGIRIDHVGGALDAALGEAARATAAACPHYRWLGPLPHAQVLRRLQRAHLLVHTSRMEGGAHAILEAVRCGTPVLASRIDGNLGMLGEAYGGYFAPGDAAGLAALLRDCREGMNAADGRLAGLAAQCRARAPLFDPERERQALLDLLGELRPGH
ncbi:selenoneine biosynthesis selenosugar synthase SenB [Hydrogenophaga crocea]|uniref:TIGR04348 family glycosyltransferase n=1 Tax=Hydrogenophaga crocea TaxID=2716225 RepID=A0A6G8IHP2_9BURK|nr:selenoneine biosynthesis selenosugar synthase SenB [Hydrogenophaga crocea]QIM52717.1 TIGR04348 family glycosyltransferase [Hydrogenophaga crocea]